MDDGVTGGRWRPQVAGGGGRDAMTSHPFVLGRANHPWLAAAEQGCSALPRYRALMGRPETGKDTAGLIALGDG